VPAALPPVPATPPAPVVPPRPPVLPPAPPIPPLPAVVVHALFTQVWPLTQQVPPHGGCAEAGQMHWLAVHVDPPAQTLPQVPQLFRSVVVSAHEPAVHCIWPVGQPLLEHALFAHTCVPVQVTVQLPQWLTSLATQALLQLRSPGLHWHVPLWQVWFIPQALPHMPQFAVEVVTSMQMPLQLIWLPVQLGLPVPPAPPLPGVPVGDGVAQLATRSARPKQATGADKKVLRTCIVRLLLLGGVSGYGIDIGSYPTAAAPG